MTFCSFSFRNSITVLFYFDMMISCKKKPIKKKILAIKIKKIKRIKLNVDKLRNIITICEY